MNPNEPKTLARQNCPDCGRPWEEHDFGVPSPYCPESNKAEPSKTPRTDALGRQIGRLLASRWKNSSIPAIASEFQTLLDDNVGQLEVELNKVRELSRLNIQTDSPVGACNCGTKTPEPVHHMPGCKYRLITERDRLRDERDACHEQFNRIYKTLPLKSGGYSGAECIDEYFRLCAENEALKEDKEMLDWGITHPHTFVHLCNKNLGGFIEEELRRCRQAITAVMKGNGQLEPSARSNAGDSERIK